MKKLPFFLLFIFAAFLIPSCSLDPEEDPWAYYEDWRLQNEAWLQAANDSLGPDGEPYYERIEPGYNTGAYILMHFFNDRAATEGNLKPLYTSTVDVKYYGRLMNGEPFDSSYNLTYSFGDSIFRFAIDGSYANPEADDPTSEISVIDGWKIAVMNMHVSDSCEVIIPYQLAYGMTGRDTTIVPYTNLKFNIKLVDIPAYEKPLN